LTGLPRGATSDLSTLASFGIGILLRRDVNGILACHGVLEPTDGLPEAAADVSEAIRAEDQQDDHEDDKQLW